MSRDIGIGTRVWVGYGFSPNLAKMAEDPRLKHATVVDGPWMPGQIFRDNVKGWARRTKEVTWEIQLDSGFTLRAAESVLFPVDDDDENEPMVEQELAEA